MLLPDPASPCAPQEAAARNLHYPLLEAGFPVPWPGEPGALFHMPFLRALHFANLTVLLQKS